MEDRYPMILKVSGPFNNSNEQAFAALALEALGVKPAGIWIDLTECSSINANGLKALFDLRRHTARIGAGLTLALSEQIEALFQLIKLDTLFEIEETVPVTLAARRILVPVGSDVTSSPRSEASSETSMARLIPTDVLRRLLLVPEVGVHEEQVVKCLSAWGFAVHKAASGIAARDLFQALRPDLVLLGLDLIDEDGLEVAKWIRLSIGDLPVQVIVFTSRTDFETKFDALKAGVDDFVDSGSGMRVLRMTLEGAMARIAGWRDGMGQP